MAFMLSEMFPRVPLFGMFSGEMSDASISSDESIGVAKITDSNKPTPAEGSNVTVNSSIDLDATATFLGVILKHELWLSAGSLASNSNLNGYLPLSKLPFLAICSLNGSLVPASRSFLS
jgi:hypothetical protein